MEYLCLKKPIICEEQLYYYAVALSDLINLAYCISFAHYLH